VSALARYAECIQSTHKLTQILLLVTPKQSLKMSAAASGRGQAGAIPAQDTSALAKAAAKTTLDLSFMEISSADGELYSQFPQGRVHQSANYVDLIEKYREEICGIMPGDKSDHPKASPVIIKLNNNDLGDITDLDAGIAAIADISKVVTLDLSFNDIHEMEGAFNSFTSLQRLYLHSNALSRFGEVLHIQADCPQVSSHPCLCHTTAHSYPLLHVQLAYLTLHGTPLREKAGYRAYVLSCLPQLRSLDFSATTPSEVRGALRWRQNNKTKAERKLAHTT